MFNFTEFIMNTLRRMINGGETDYKVMQYSAGWYKEGVLTDENLMEIQTLIEAREVSEEVAENG